MAAINIKPTRCYKPAFKSAMEVFEVSKKLPKEEIYSLTDQAEGLPEVFVLICRRAYRKKK